MNLLFDSKKKQLEYIIFIPIKKNYTLIPDAPETLPRTMYLWIKTVKHENGNASLTGTCPVFQKLKSQDLKPWVVEWSSLNHKIGPTSYIYLEASPLETQIKKQEPRINVEKASSNQQQIETNYQVPHHPTV
jgi:hypothetical protein